MISKTGFLAFQGYFPTWQGEVVIYNLQGEVVRPKGENWEGATLQELFREQVTFSILDKRKAYSSIKRIAKSLYV